MAVAQTDPVIQDLTRSAHSETLFKIPSSYKREIAQGTISWRFCLQLGQVIGR